MSDDRGAIYTVFVRNWWRWERTPSGRRYLVPNPGARKTILARDSRRKLRFTRQRAGLVRRVVAFAYRERLRRRHVAPRPKWGGSMSGAMVFLEGVDPLQQALNDAGSQFELKRQAARARDERHALIVAGIHAALDPLLDRISALPAERFAARENAAHRELAQRGEA